MRTCCNKNCSSQVVHQEQDISFLDKATLLELLNCIRKSFARNSPHYSAAVNKSITSDKGPKGGVRYRCAHCSVSFGRREIQVDHVEPFIPLGVSPAEMTLRMLYERCWVKPEGLQILCKSCHSVKSKAENLERRVIKKARELKVKK